ncbi:hypothetical protein GCM10011390_26880 [Aureimonas endophytica]|uniref:Uncharacterized protein n=1 Tax=Aureimonas endophytica TaxID=2027858 RepID=A0A916ZPX9_9HYPH|nr:hypothetical protein [Aureimonas endophytica]GGE06385.1 hypothetical protein GCM10011390_26880 [Aureimonas endophytica]
MAEVFRPALFALALAAALPARAEEAAPQPPADQSTAAEPDYLDDRSTPDAVIRSLYNAIDRKEYVRAWSYFRDEPDRPAFADFAKGYAETAGAAVRTGKAVSDGAAGSIYYTLPVAVRAVDVKGRESVFTGCYQLRLVQPGIQAEPPFHPLGIVKGKLEASSRAFSEAMGTCPQGGL